MADTLAVADGRAFHAFHVEGCGGGHAPNVLELAGVANVIGSSTNPTLPFGRDAVAEHLDMIALVHGLDPERDAALARDRIRAGTMAAEGVAARPRRHPDHLLRCAGHGPGRGDGAPHVRPGLGDEAALGALAPLLAPLLAPTTTSGCCGTWPS